MDQFFTGAIYQVKNCNFGKRNLSTKISIRFNEVFHNNFIDAFCLSVKTLKPHLLNQISQRWQNTAGVGASALLRQHIDFYYFHLWSSLGVYYSFDMMSLWSVGEKRRGGHVLWPGNLAYKATDLIMVSLQLRSVHFIEINKILMKIKMLLWLRISGTIFQNLHIKSKHVNIIFMGAVIWIQGFVTWAKLTFKKSFFSLPEIS